jgi:hypothetical protein
MTPSSLLLGMFVPLAGESGGRIGWNDRQWVCRGAFVLRQRLRLKGFTHLLTPHFVSVALGEPSDAHRHSVIRQSLLAGWLAWVIRSTCILLERARSNWKDFSRLSA